jgi:predicted secreted protein
MKKTYKRLIVFAIAFIATLGILFYMHGQDTYEPGENGTIKLVAGETFNIALNENPSTGAHTAWLQMPEGITLVSHNFEQYWYSQKDCEGCGGITTYTFKTTLPGTYTLTAADCPPGKNCTAENTKPSNIFTIKAAR